ncbi:hypothetical protein RF11_10055 [Thelohanellus kitauei]|uniref:Kelch domain-containing protein 10 n=1 Tax=Thelohanellus kitauei TaxID=669202 RepID=A0A0C2MVH7_THEKT|nr:hypothetical protein RF11_10055 [Thelohanellus kitauei]
MSGGRNFDTDTDLLDIWRIDLETLEWVKLDKSLPRTIYSHRMSVVEDCFLYNVGAYEISSRYFDVMERFILKVPSLFRICLESVCRLPNITNYINLLPPYIVDHLNL